MSQDDIQILNDWLKLAVKVENIEEFEQKVVGNSSKI